MNKCDSISYNIWFKLINGTIFGVIDSRTRKIYTKEIFENITDNIKLEIIIGSRK